MNRKNKFASLLKYEFLNTMNGFFTPFFGIVLPVIMGVVLTQTIPGTVPENMAKEVTIGIMLTIATMIPMAIMLVSFPSGYAQEVEQKVVYRLSLFGILDRNLLYAKILINIFLMTVSMILYYFVLGMMHDIGTPAVSSIIVLILCLYLMAAIYFVFSFSIANIFKKFGFTYAITMVLYFISMFFSGMMGAQPDNLPANIKFMTKFFPAAFINMDFAQYWEKGFSGYNFAPLLQSLLFNAGIAGIILVISIYYNRRKL